MNLRILSLPLLGAGLLLGCNPDPRPPATPSDTASPVANQPRTPGSANTLTVYMNLVSTDGVGESAGTIVVSQTANGLMFAPDLLGMTAGRHGFHIHQNPSCEPAMKDGKRQAAAAAGGHYDPTNQGTHAGPHGEGHKGDLPMIEIDDSGRQQAVTINGLTLDNLRNRSLVVHQGRDDYSSDPAGESGPPIACGVIKER